MNFDYKKLGLAAGWVLIIVAAALFARVESTAAWVVVSIVGLAPCLVMWHFWQGVPQTTTESIHEARR